MVLKIKNLGKAYKYYPEKIDRLIEWATFGVNKKHQLRWVLRNINFSARRGEAIGILGANGAGKSTLLKMIAGTSKQTLGVIEKRGRISALLELGMGFHPDFTGRQNALISGQLMGMTSEEIAILMPEIEKFADIGEYFDQTIRVYSSGMLARVAFAVATAIKPDILIVDEILSVGDIAFQAKCMQRMESLLEGGSTILLVSHSPHTVRQFCHRVIYIANGTIVADGDTATVCDLYQNSLVHRADRSPGIEGSKIEYLSIFKEDQLLRVNSVLDSSGTEEAVFTAFEMSNSEGDPINTYNPLEVVSLKVWIKSVKHIKAGAAVGLLICDKAGYPLLSCNSNLYDFYLPELYPGERVSVSWRLHLPFYIGDYRIDIGLKPDPFSPQFYDRVFCVKTFTCNTPIKLARNNFGGMLYMDASVNLERH